MLSRSMSMHRLIPPWRLVTFPERSWVMLPPEGVDARIGERHGSPEIGGWQVPGVLGRRLARGGERRERRRLAVWLAWGAFALTVAFTTAGVLLLGFLSDPDAAAGWAGEFQGWLLATLALPFSFVGALIIARRPGNRIGQLLLVGAMSFAAFLAVGGYLHQGWGAREGPARAGLGRLGGQLGLDAGVGRAAAVAVAISGRPTPLAPMAPGGGGGPWLECAGDPRPSSPSRSHRRRGAATGDRPAGCCRRPAAPVPVITPHAEPSARFPDRGCHCTWYARPPFARRRTPPDQVAGVCGQPGIAHVRP